MRVLVYVLCTIYFCVCFAPNIYNKGMESSVDVYYTCDLFHFCWDWKADRISVAEPKRMESKKMLTQMPLDPRDWPKWLKQDLSHETAEIQLSAKNDKKVIEQGCGSATRFRDCCTKKKIKKNLLSPSHVAARRSRRYKTRRNTEFVFGRLHEM